jgi:hypothetical protein
MFSVPVVLLLLSLFFPDIDYKSGAPAILLGAVPFILVLIQLVLSIAWTWRAGHPRFGVMALLAALFWCSVMLLFPAFGAITGAGRTWM